MNDYHIPALLYESIEGLNISSDGIYVDVTYGGGGHSEEILRKLAEEQKSKGDTKTLEPTYDHASGKYLAFEDWFDQFLRHWEKLPSP